MKSHPHSKGFSLTELLVVIVIIITLAAIAIPVIRKSMKRAEAVNCSGNLRQIGMAVQMYAGDNQMTLPVTTHQRRKGGKSWVITLQPYASGTLTFKCAQDPAKNRAYTYQINDFLTPNPAGAPQLDFSRMAKIDRPESTILFAEAHETNLNSDHFHFSQYHGGTVPASEFEHQIAVEMHGDRSNYLFADGHVETLTWKEVQARLSNRYSRFVDPSDPDQPSESLR